MLAENDRYHIARLTEVGKIWNDQQCKGTSSAGCAPRLSESGSSWSPTTWGRGGAHHSQPSGEDDGNAPHDDVRSAALVRGILQEQVIANKFRQDPRMI